MDFSSFYNLNPTEFSSAVIVFNLFFSLFLQLFIIYIYKKTRHGLSHSQSFIFSIIIFGVLSTAIMMAVQNNIIGAFAIFSAFTLVRFRSILKEPSDLAYIFFALVIGIASGMSHYSLALITALFLGLIIYGFHRFGLGKVVENFDYLLILVTDKNFRLDSLNVLFDEHLERREFLHAKHYENNQSEYGLLLHLKETDNLNILVDQLNTIPLIKRVEVLSSQNTAEY
ncbi:MAG: hypothetical protein US72_C0002G0034 [Microgenomates group bacterium GW2011_GWC1_38_12]|uniref:DUF4956 domain-containing protein n=1 Tax=Candidatus Vogelbacteria bacterium RIFOXYB1_FULL_42_16 TaxID=1802436 RepID=A0A1G2QFE4_9BACT|nr:MAG: hypothetical protein US72_C0002G0034 [Microgenomates group bacterium GW2011_GWC1_38_12]KKS78140.1 MAG: hypothetical protein UV50_C0001G0050 [Parcubacteria group bacterium GW2011_GWB1_42_9]OHA59133.1 MAG: hypothetical protein A2370_03030 [Candidatus Vogelbacteria bacterium RIFOXYB1_FULL_42_16]